MTDRRRRAREIRRHAAELAAARPHPPHRANGEEFRYRDEHGRPTFIGSFTKCLPHDDDGFLADFSDYVEWVRAVDSAAPSDIARLALGSPPWKAFSDDVAPRGWESQGVGSTFDLEGPDAQSLTLPPAPALDSEELVAEMAELYWMALCRDVPFADWPQSSAIGDALDALGHLRWFRADRPVDGSTDRLATSQARRRILRGPNDVFTLAKLFRGTLPGERVGPYLSQFLVAGSRGVNAGDDAYAHSDGYLAYGALRIDQRVRQAPAGVDYLTRFDEWLDVQNGADVRGREAPYVGYRFIATPRDLTTYVHYDAVYEAYLNACLLLLSIGAPFDPGLPFLRPDVIDRQLGFVTFGAPHVLTLLAEVTMRALKAVKYQKFNVHRRVRPEAVAGYLHQRATSAKPSVKARLAVLEPMLDALSFHTVGLDDALGGSWLLPMAFPEGSPTHPSYGAGHATVAGACTTILKGWFDHGWTLPFAFAPNRDGSALIDVSGDTPALSVEGELNKLAANIALGRGWAGVHYYSDFIESYRLGEQVALGLLEEQKLCYGETWSLSIPLHDGTATRL